MNRRGFLGALAAAWVSSMMIRSLGQTHLLLPEPERTRQVVVVLTGPHNGAMASFVAAEDLIPGDIVEFGPDGKVRRARGANYPAGVYVADNP